MQFRSAKDIPFGIEGWSYGEVKPTSITFFTDGTALVADHRGNPIEKLGMLTLPMLPPTNDEDSHQKRAKFPRHAEVIAELASTGIDWQKLVAAGWPQLEYDELKKIEELPKTPRDELVRIRNKALRTDALQMRDEADAEMLALAEVE